MSKDNVIVFDQRTPTIANLLAEILNTKKIVRAEVHGNYGADVYIFYKDKVIKEEEE